MNFWAFFRRYSLCKGLANAIHLSRHHTFTLLDAWAALQSGTGTHLSAGTGPIRSSSPSSGDGAQHAAPPAVRQDAATHTAPTLLLPCPLLPAAKIASLQATVLLLLTLLIKARVRIVAFSALGFTLLLLQTLVFLAVAGAAAVIWQRNRSMAVS